MKNKFNLLKKIIVFFVIMPSLMSLIQLIGFWALYLSLTSPILLEYQNLFEFKVGLISAAMGIAIVQVTIILKSMNYIFENNEKERN